MQILGSTAGDVASIVGIIAAAALAVGVPLITHWRHRNPPKPNMLEQLERQNSVSLREIDGPAAISRQYLRPDCLRLGSQASPRPARSAIQAVHGISRHAQRQPPRSHPVSTRAFLTEGTFMLNQNLLFTAFKHAP